MFFLSYETCDRSQTLHDTRIIYRPFEPDASTMDIVGIHGHPVIDPTLSASVSSLDLYTVTDSDGQIVIGNVAYQDFVLEDLKDYTRLEWQLYYSQSMIRGKPRKPDESVCFLISLLSLSIEIHDPRRGSTISFRCEKG